MTQTRQLSDPDAVTPVFDLTCAQWRPIVETAAGEAVAGFSLAIERAVEGYYGGCGDKLIPTITYRTQAGRLGQVTIFVKRFSWKGCSEAVHYRHLARQGLPNPRALRRCDEPGERGDPVPGVHGHRRLPQRACG